jgi:hypothetical protein
LLIHVIGLDSLSDRSPPPPSDYFFFKSLKRALNFHKTDWHISKRYSALVGSQNSAFFSARNSQDIGNPFVAVLGNYSRRSKFHVCRCRTQAHGLFLSCFGFGDLRQFDPGSRAVKSSKYFTVEIAPYFSNQSPVRERPHFCPMPLKARAVKQLYKFIAMRSLLNRVFACFRIYARPTKFCHGLPQLFGTG